MSSLANPSLQDIIAVVQTTQWPSVQPIQEVLQQYLAHQADTTLEKFAKQFAWCQDSTYCNDFHRYKRQLLEYLYEQCHITPSSVLEDLKDILPDTIQGRYVKSIVLLFEPKTVKVPEWAPSCCPTCGIELSEHHGDGYFTHPTFLEHCPNCHQAIQWPTHVW